MDSINYWMKISCKYIQVPVRAVFHGIFSFVSHACSSVVTSLSLLLCAAIGRAIAMLFIYNKKKNVKRSRIKEMNSLKHDVEGTPADHNFYGACFHFTRD